MDCLNIKSSGWTPEVTFNAEDNKLCIFGRSFPEDVSAFYEPIENWLKKNICECVSGFNLEVQLDYFNATSSKYLLHIMRIIEDFKKNCNVSVSVSVLWKYNANDDDMKEFGLEYQEFVSIPFVLEEVTTTSPK